MVTAEAPRLRETLDVYVGDLVIEKAADAVRDLEDYGRNYYTCYRRVVC